MRFNMRNVVWWDSGRCLVNCYLMNLVILGMFVRLQNVDLILFFSLRNIEFWSSRFKSDYLEFILGVDSQIDCWIRKLILGLNLFI